ncbi:MAG: hypothetical protein ACUVT6_10595 [Thermodesulfobacteriota bacterium]
MTEVLFIYTKIEERRWQCAVAHIFEPVQKWANRYHLMAAF